MRRHPIAILLTVFAITLASCGAISLFMPFDGSGWITSRTWLALFSHRGSIRVFLAMQRGDLAGVQATKGETQLTQEGLVKLIFTPVYEEVPEIQSYLDPSPSPARYTGLSIGFSPTSWIEELLYPNLRVGMKLPFGGATYRLSMIRLPAFPIAAALLIYPTAIAIRQRRRRRRNQCLNCGYNLTALIEPRCPECGTPCEA